MGVVLMVGKTFLLVWLVPALLFFIFLRSNKRVQNHSFQRDSDTYGRRLKLSLIWPYWFFGLLFFSLKRKRR